MTGRDKWNRHDLSLPVLGCQAVIQTHAQTFLDMRDRGFVNYAAEARVPGLSSDIAEKENRLKRMFVSAGP